MTGALAFVSVRLCVGVVFAVAPSRALRGWLGNQAPDPLAVALARGMGIRDLGLGVDTLVALRRRTGVAPWLIGAAIVEAADAVVGATAAGPMARPQRLVAALGPTGLAVAALALARRAAG